MPPATSPPPRQRLLLVGGGHAHLFVLEALAREPRPDLDITLISPERWQHYSGMLPGHLAGHYPAQDCRIDLHTLARQAGIAFIEDAIIGMDADKQCICLRDGRHLFYELLSLDTGCETETTWLAALGERLLPIKPLHEFHAAWALLRAQAAACSGYHLAIVGGGAGGVELALAAARALRSPGSDRPGARISLITGESGLLPHFPSATRKHARAALERAGIALIAQRGAGHPDGLRLTDGSLLAADRVIAVTGARPPVWLPLSRLRLDPAGYLAVDRWQRSPSHPTVFAAGDLCARTDLHLARSGVHAVRTGPVLAHNLLATLDGRPLRSYRPRPAVLYLLATADGRAIASWGPFSAEGRWVWRWKDWIDRRFIQRFSPHPPHNPAQAPESTP